MLAPLTQSSTIAVRNLSFCYRPDVPLFENISFSLTDPGLYSIFGRSGLGKSTLGKILAGCTLNVPAGAISVPTPVLYASSDDILPHWTSVSKHLHEFLPPHAEDRLRAYWAVADLDSKVENSLPSQLSLGQRQRANLARYLIRDAACLILDEALIGVDQPTRWNILKWIKAERRNVTTIMISHEVDDVAIFSKQIIKLEKGAPAHIKILHGSDLDDALDATPTSHSMLRAELTKR